VVLHPRHKLAYFREAQRDACWVDEAERIAREEWEHLYAQTDSGSSASSDIELLDTGRAPGGIQVSTHPFLLVRQQCKAHRTR
ncbi:hypothetical protein CERSUDRAFT_60947, partial [Gelatoporia subvermispora B]